MEYRSAYEISQRTAINKIMSKRVKKNLNIQPSDATYRNSNIRQRLKQKLESKKMSS